MVGAGARLGPYEVLAPLGAGGMGEVYRARDTRLGRDVAIKALPEAFAGDADRLARFEREARLLASLSHPNVAAIYGLEEFDGQRYLVLEYVEGETLAERLARGPLPIDETIEVCMQIAAGVEAAHESGVVHRDLKPGNIKITPSGQVKVLDFGLAKGGAAAGGGSNPNLTVSPTITNAMTQAGVILGTAAYMSPEQARGKAVDRRTDIWSFGCVMYECLTGRRLYRGETVSDLIARILEREPDWALLPPSTPGRVRALLARCLRKDAKERLRDIGDARLELSEAGKADATVSGAAAAPVPLPVRRARRAHPLWLALPLVAVAGGGFAAARLTSADPASRTLRVSVQAPEGVEVSDEVPDVTISPDGGTLAFTAQDTSGVTRLWLRPLSSAAARPLPGTEDAKLPFWSPDSRHLAFFADGNLKRMPVTGEAAQLVCAAPNPRGGAWGTGDVIVFAPTASGPLMQVLASGGETQPATTLDPARGETAHRFPSFLPDGRRFLYAALPGNGTQLDTRVGTLDAKPGPVVVAAPGAALFAEPGFLLFNRQGASVAQRFDVGALRVSGAPRPIRDLTDVTGSYSGSPALSASRTGILVQREARSVDTRIDLLDRAGQARAAVSLPAGRFYGPRFSPDGSRLVLASSRPGMDTSPIWTVDLERGISSRFTFEGVAQLSAIWTRDGGKILYGSEQKSGRDLYWKPTDGAGPEALLADVPNLFNDPLDVTPDGRFLVYRSLSGETGEDLWMVSLVGDPNPEPLIQTRFNEMEAAISPDGRWIAYRSDESGRFEIYVRSFPGLEQKQRVSVDGAQPIVNTSPSFTRWRSDGREILFIGSDGQTVMSAPVEPGETFRAGTPRPLFRLPRGAHDADVSPDGQRFAVCMPTGAQGRSLINLVMNWAPELEDVQ